jgi:hypothetical protein
MVLNQNLAESPEVRYFPIPVKHRFLDERLSEIWKQMNAKTNIEKLYNKPSDIDMNKHFLVTYSSWSWGTFMSVLKALTLVNLIPMGCILLRAYSKLI